MNRSHLFFACTTVTASALVWGCSRPRLGCTFYSSDSDDCRSNDDYRALYEGSPGFFVNDAGDSSELDADASDSEAADDAAMDAADGSEEAGD